MNKNVSIIGLGKLGLCLALNLEKNGYNVIGVDIIDEYIESLKNKTFKSSEKDVENYLRDSKNIKFSTCLKDALEYDTIFIVVNTPSTSDWRYDHYQIDNIIDELIKIGRQDKRKDIIINCTTFPKYCKSVQERLKDYNYYVSYNPEFIAQGTIIRDQQYPDMILIGQADEYAGYLIERINLDICKNSPLINKMSVTEAEITKLSINCFLTTKITFANMIGDIANRYDSNPNLILNAIGSDSRVGNKYLKYGFGFGGPCFPRDNRALTKCAKDVGIDAEISKATDLMNNKHLQYQIEDFVKNNKDKNIPIDIEYITYKRESIILEESQQLKFAKELENLGYIINILDNRKEVQEELKKYEKSSK